MKNPTMVETPIIRLGLPSNENKQVAVFKDTVVLEHYNDAGDVEMAEWLHIHPVEMEKIIRFITGEQLVITNETLYQYEINKAMLVEKYGDFWADTIINRFMLPDVKSVTVTQNNMTGGIMLTSHTV